MKNETEQLPKIVAICGSTRFIELIAVTAWTFEKEGCIALAPLLLPSGYISDSHAAEAEGVKDQIDELFKRKIDLADKVFVVNKDGYIGESTRSEIDYALKLGKPVYYLEPQAKASRPPAMPPPGTAPQSPAVASPDESSTPPTAPAPAPRGS